MRIYNHTNLCVYVSTADATGTSFRVFVMEREAETVALDERRQGGASQAGRGEEEENERMV